MINEGVMIEVKNDEMKNKNDVENEAENEERREE